MAAVDGGRSAVVVTTTSVDCRYDGQSHELTVPTVADFGKEHRRRNGYDRPDSPIEVVALRASASGPALLDPSDLPPVERASVLGPAVLAEADCTVWVPDGWHGEPGTAGALILRRTR